MAGDVSDLPWVEVVVPVPAEPLDTAPGAGGADGAADEAANAPGWFDATWALQQGLDVIEGLPADLALALWREAAAA
ncbi:hypothetical protein ISF6_2666 [Piscinibacter sakaiensis]|uniref:Uncharacterized protein n=1 Tax=Piscinibacter sakaiensis TaxID=1547922 RepID=A0A0K8P2H1_PISS1|nr:hypothetical protein ISF6_2666 [Piscinibacter sakaiensis]